jgi:hypothetical protein
MQIEAWGLKQVEFRIETKMQQRVKTRRFFETVNFLDWSIYNLGL